MHPAFFVAWRTNFQRNLSIYRNIMRVCFCFRQYIQNLLKKTNRSCTKVFSRLKFLHVVICPLKTLHSWATSFLTIHLLFKCCLWTHALLSPFLKKCLLMVHNYASFLVLPYTFMVTSVFDLYPDEPNHHLCCGYCCHQKGKRPSWYYFPDGMCLRGRERKHSKTFKVANNILFFRRPKFCSGLDVWDAFCTQNSLTWICRSTLSFGNALAESWICFFSLDCF